MEKKRFIPRYAIIPSLIVIAANFIAYYGGDLIASGFHHYNIETPLDDKLPFIEFFVVFYVLAYVQWVMSYILIAREGKALFYKFVVADVLAKVMCLIIFIAFPTTISHQGEPGNNPFGFVTKIVYFFDSPTNLFPSIHCLESWICLRAALQMKKVPTWYKPFTCVFSVAVFLSTVFLKQHVVVDIPAGILVFELALIIVNLTGLDKKILGRIKSKNKEI